MHIYIYIYMYKVPAAGTRRRADACCADGVNATS